MKLKTYLASINATDAEFAKKLGKDRSAITKYRSGKITPPLDVIAMIDKITKGAVSFRDFLSKGGA